ncbi:MAG: DUF5680 domain-containing protein [Defluviitaleaceae bacterium]|nr:DUF5680 domain-containing protein [Defluviitaleaceae bacterium]
MDKNVIEFLVKAKQTIFAGNGEKLEPSRPNSKNLRFAEGDLQYIDTYLGGAKFAGEEALWRDDKSFWAMNYIGRLLSQDSSIFDFLNEALLLVSAEYPYRGPLRHENGDYLYICAVEGDFHWFSGVEEVFYKGDKVYELVFHGGDVL